jgi:hypothetical protein
MDILAAIKREERKLEKQLGKLEHQLSGVRAAAKALEHVEREVIGVKKRVLSAAGRAAIVKATKKRWAKRKRSVCTSRRSVGGCGRWPEVDTYESVHLGDKWTLWSEQSLRESDRDDGGRWGRSAGSSNRL